jgi:hypothetical protein
MVVARLVQHHELYDEVIQPGLLNGQTEQLDSTSSSADAVRTIASMGPAV